jgi:hypothetical protein
VQETNKIRGMSLLPTKLTKHSSSGNFGVIPDGLTLEFLAEKQARVVGYLPNESSRLLECVKRYVARREARDVELQLKGPSL